MPLPDQPGPRGASLLVKASNWEFRHRALIFGLIFAFTFSLYAVDPQNVTAAVADRVSLRIGWSADLVTHLLFACAACLLIAAAGLRTWASAYLQAGVVYAPEVKTESLVADGPYRYVRNPLYLANVLMAISMGAMMSRTGCVLAVVLMLVFCFRLILREESDLGASQGATYERYRSMVPRLWPSLRPIAAAARRPKWSAGFTAEFWYWGFAAAIAVFAITLKATMFYVILGVSIALFWVCTWLLQRKPTPEQ
jgi:protein-S-isoprenylcysteine O-methyltransferase Ste14